MNHITILELSFGNSSSTGHDQSLQLTLELQTLSAMANIWFYACMAIFAPHSSTIFLKRSGCFHVLWSCRRKRSGRSMSSHSCFLFLKKRKLHNILEQKKLNTPYITMASECHYSFLSLQSHVLESEIVYIILLSIWALRSIPKIHSWANLTKMQNCLWTPRS